MTRSARQPSLNWEMVKDSVAILAAAKMELVPTRGRAKLEKRSRVKGPSGSAQYASR